MSDIRHDWSGGEVRAIHDLPLVDLVNRAHQTHREHFPAGGVQLASLLSIKTGGCPEDCAYCPQSSRHGKAAERMLAVDEVLEAASRARDAGANRFCMGAAWREVKDGQAFDRVLDMVRGVRGLGLDACVTLGMLNEDQARRLKEAGLTAYNHNLDTGEEYYGEIISTRTWQDRLNTLAAVRKAGITLCCGGIIGMGESVDDRCSLLRTLANMDPHPESVPINALVPVEGTPLQDRKPVHPFELTRMIATARILMPKTMVRLSAGRTGLSDEAQFLCLFAGANSIFHGDKLLTTPNPGAGDDRRLLEAAGLRPLECSSTNPAADAAE
ncbi:MAG: Biotin synthase [Myxococcota bacterium]|nr:Biotin synthase [Myxococcota bacterium]